MPCKQESKTVSDRSLENVDTERRIKTIEGLLQRSVSDDDRSALEVMLVNAVEERHRRQQVDLDSLMNKTADVEVINVNDSPPMSTNKFKCNVVGSKIAPKKHPSPKLSPKPEGKKKLTTPTKKSIDSSKHK